MLAPAYLRPLLGPYSSKPIHSFHAPTGPYGLPLPARSQRCLSPAGERTFEPESGDAEPLRARVKGSLGTTLEARRKCTGDVSAASGSKHRHEGEKEAEAVIEEMAERRRRVAMIKQGARSTNGGRSYLLPGLWACRLAAGLTQRQLAEAIGGTQTTVRKLERQARGAYPKTIRRLCEALGVAPEDLICGGGTER